QDYMTIWDYSFDPIVLGINKELFDSMSEDDQKLLKDAAEEANAYQIEQAQELEAEQLKELEEKGMDIYELTDEEKEAFLEALEPVYDKYESVWGEDLLETFRQ